MSSPTLADRILAALSKEPMTERDLALTLPRVALDAIRVKLVELKRAGKAVVHDGVWKLAAGVVTPLAPDDDGREDIDPPAAAPEAPRAAISSDSQVCTDCREDLPLSDFPRNGGGGRHQFCRRCQGARIRAGQQRKAAAARGESAQCEASAEVGQVAAGLGVSPETVASDLARAHYHDGTPVAAASAHPFTLVGGERTIVEGEPIASVHRTFTLSVRDVFGVRRTVVLDDAGRDAALEALQEAVLEHGAA